MNDFNCMRCAIRMINNHIISPQKKNENPPYLQHQSTVFLNGGTFLVSQSLVGVDGNTGFVDGSLVVEHLGRVALNGYTA